MPEWKQEIRERLAGVKLAPPRAAEIVQELAQHLEVHDAEWLAGDATEEDATGAALAEFSESELLARERRRVGWPAPPEPVVFGARGGI